MFVKELITLSYRICGNGIIIICLLYLFNVHQINSDDLSLIFHVYISLFILGFFMMASLFLG